MKAFKSAVSNTATKAGLEAAYVKNKTTKNGFQHIEEVAQWIVVRYSFPWDAVDWASSVGHSVSPPVGFHLRLHLQLRPLLRSPQFKARGNYLINMLSIFNGRGICRAMKRKSTLHYRIPSS